MSYSPLAPTSNSLAADLATPYQLTEAQCQKYRREGFIKLREVLSPAVLAYYGAEITREVKRRSLSSKPLAERDTYGKAFLQIGNIWTTNQVVAEFVRSPRLARLAGELMGTRGVRIYHDQALFKEPGGGYTPWHADQRYWPLGSDLSTTAWVPLQATPLAMGPLAFAVGSQHLVAKRDALGLAISDESEDIIGRTLNELTKIEESYDLGEVSFHAGWTFHRAGPNLTDTPRAVMTVIYIDSEMLVAEPRNESQIIDSQSFFPGLKPGDLAASPLNPIVWQDDPASNP